MQLFTVQYFDITSYISWTDQTDPSNVIFHIIYRITKERNEIILIWGTGEMSGNFKTKMNIKNN